MEVASIFSCSLAKEASSCFGRLIGQGSSRVISIIKTRSSGWPRGIVKIMLIFTFCAFAKKIHDYYQARSFVDKLAKILSPSPINLRTAGFVQSGFFWQSKPDPNPGFSRIYDESSSVEFLNLRGLNLTDEYLRLMACSGRFSSVTTLILEDNPRLTGRGIAYLAEGNFENLKNLYLRSNPQLIRTGLREGLKIPGFRKLELLDLSGCSVSCSDLEIIIEESELLKRIKCLIIKDYSEKFPANILKLTALKDHELNGQSDIYSRGGGILFCPTLDREFERTPEEILLIMAGKALGPPFLSADSSLTSLLLFSLSRSSKLSFEEVCRKTKVVLPVSDPTRMAALAEACVRYEIPF